MSVCVCFCFIAQARVFWFSVFCARSKKRAHVCFCRRGKRGVCVCLAAGFRRLLLFLPLVFFLCFVVACVFIGVLCANPTPPFPVQRKIRRVIGRGVDRTARRFSPTSAHRNRGCDAHALLPPLLTPRCAPLPPPRRAFATSTHNARPAHACGRPAARRAARARAACAVAQAGGSAAAWCRADGSGACIEGGGAWERGGGCERKERAHHHHHPTHSRSLSPARTPPRPRPPPPPPPCPPLRPPSGSFCAPTQFGAPFWDQWR